MHPLQEKFQVTVPAKNDEAPDAWVFPAPTRNKTRRGPSAINEVDGEKFNFLPPGMELDNQTHTEINNMPLSMAGASDVSADTNSQSFAEGFTRRRMKGSDDQYTGEHVDHFYGDAGGFAERNNYLDRE